MFEDQRPQRRILAVADVKGWAFWHNVTGMARYAPDDVHVEVITQGEFHQYTNHKPHLLMEFDAVFQMSWAEASFSSKARPLPFKRNVSLVASHGCDCEWPFDPKTPVPSRIATANRNRYRAGQRFPKFDALLCTNRALTESARSLGGNAHYTPMGVDHQQFTATDALEYDERPLKVGWCGQAAGVTKGYREVLQPLQEACPQYDWCVNRNGRDTAISHNDMPLWFQSLDVFLCTSCSEGTPTPIYEAASCGIPVIGTNVGGMSELVDNGKNGFIVCNWSNAREARDTVETFQRLLAECDADRERLRVLGANARRTVEQRCSWQHRSAVWCNAILEG